MGYLRKNSFMIFSDEGGRPLAPPVRRARHRRGPGDRGGRLSTSRKPGWKGRLMRDLQTCAARPGGPRIP
ncbi:hypothetical protein SAMN05216532_0457 [Streptomyces sp. 2231.1]|nr:hypothetical protein SAMN05216532_0457 [Streptomyces sp. 2231.1]